MMFNEARRLLAADGRRLVKRVESGKLGPEQIGPVVLFTIARRVSKAGDATVRALCERAVRTKASGRTHSELFGYKLSALLTSTLVRLEPDVQRGILFYVCGDDKQHGLAVLGLEILAESSAVEVTGRLVSWRREVIGRLQADDEKTRRAVDDLPPQVRRLCLGAFAQASFALQDGDDRTVASWTRQVRTLVKRFGRPEGGR